MEFNATFNDISIISLLIFQLYRCCQFYWWRKPEDPEKTIDLSQTLSHNVASSTPRHVRGSSSQLEWLIGTDCIGSCTIQLPYDYDHTCKIVWCTWQQINIHKRLIVFICFLWLHIHLQLRIETSTICISSVSPEKIVHTRTIDNRLFAYCQFDSIIIRVYTFLYELFPRRRAKGTCSRKSSRKDNEFEYHFLII